MITHRQVKKISFWFLVVSAVLTIAFFSSLPLLVRSQYLEQLVSQKIKEQLNYNLSFAQLRVSFFPSPAVHIDQLQLSPVEGAEAVPLIRSDEAVVRPSLLSLFFGPARIAHLALEDAAIHYTWRSKEGGVIKNVLLQDVDVDLWNLGPNRPIRFKVHGKWLDDSENVTLGGTVQTPFDQFSAKKLVSKVQLSVGPIDLKRLADWWGSPLAIVPEKGTWSFSGHVTKSAGNSALEIKGTSHLRGLVYKLPPKPALSKAADYQVQFLATIDLESGSLVLKESRLMAPFGGPFDLDGKFNLLKPGVDEFFVKSKAVRLEELPQYVLALEKALPVNMGFSGESQIDFLLKGQPEFLLIDLRADLTKTTLTYADYFSKPSGVPLFLKGDLKLAGGRVLRGDFGLEFESASLKGSLVGLDFVTGEGELTVLTNKFAIDGWQQYFPLLRSFDLGGGVKILTSLKGNLNRLNEVRVMNNISLDGLWAKAANGAEIRNLNGSIDLGPLDSELKDIQYSIGNSEFSMEGKMFSQPESRWLIRMHSPKIDIRDFIFQIHKATEALRHEGANLDWNAIGTSVAQLIPPAETLDSFDAEFALSPGQVLVPRLRFDVFGGSVSGRAVYDYLKQPQISLAEVELSRLSLARIQAHREKQIVNGNLFAVATLTGEGPFNHEWLDRLTGKGSVAVTNGEFHGFDILGGLGEITELAALGRFKSGVTRFNDIRGDFQVGERKVGTQNLLLVSDDFQVEGVGDLGFDGNLNFRLSVYLEPHLGQKISSRISENVRLGPIPILVVGPVSKPSIRKDPMLIRTFVESLVQEQFSRITSRIMPSSHRQAPTEPTLANRPAGEPKKLEEAIVEGGLNLLEQFLSQKKTTS